MRAFDSDGPNRTIVTGNHKPLLEKEQQQGDLRRTKMRKSPVLEELAQFFLIWNLQSVPLWPLKNLGLLSTSLWSFISVILFSLGVYFYLVSIWNTFTNWECISTTWFECFAVCLEFKNSITFSSVIEMWRCLGYNFCPPINHLFCLSHLAASTPFSRIILYLSGLKCVLGWRGWPCQMEICSSKHCLHKNECSAKYGVH